MGLGAPKRKLQAPQAQESGEALVWDPVLQEAGLVGARWTQVGAVEWGCGGGTGCNAEDTGHHCKGLRWGQRTGDHSLSHTTPNYWVLL